jgi:hypothetical protein
MTKTIPSVGDTVYSITVHGVSHAQKRLCTVNRIVNNADGDFINAAFGEYVDSDGIKRHPHDWNVVDWIAPGDTVKATDIPGYSHLDGSVVTVTRIHKESGTNRPYFEAKGFNDPRYPDSPDLELAFYGAEKCDPLSDQPKHPLDLEVERLKAALTRAQERLSQQQTIYRNDMGHIEVTMRAVKDEQGWCDEGTNDVIERINEGLEGGWEFDRYEQEYEFTVTVTGTMTKTLSVTVSAVSEDAAREMVEESPDEYLSDDTDSILTEAARNISFEDVEVEVQ